MATVDNVQGGGGDTTGDHARTGDRDVAVVASVPDVNRGPDGI